MSAAQRSSVGGISTELMPFILSEPSKMGSRIPQIFQMVSTQILDDNTIHLSPESYKCSIHGRRSFYISMQ